MTEENIIRQHDSGRMPFTTPDGYFEGFTERLMQRVDNGELGTPQSDVAPAEPKVVRMNAVRRFMRYAAAVVVAAGCLGGGAYIYDRYAAVPVQANASDYLLDEDNIDDILDYEMLNNRDIAYYLTEAY